MSAPEIVCPVCNSIFNLERAGAVKTTAATAEKPAADPPKPAGRVLVDIVSTLARKAAPRLAGKRKGLVIHHSATAMALGGSKPEAYARYHTEEKGWPTIAYTVVVQPDGKAFLTLRPNEVGYHGGDANTDYCGVCFSGDFDTETLPASALAGGADACRELLGLLGLDPKTAEIRPHSDFSPKTCPGTCFPLKELIRQVRG